MFQIALSVRGEKLCVHCLGQLTKPTKDHVFPSSWYTDDTPNEIQRWTVPSCVNCNGKFGKLEHELFIRLVPCIDPTKAEASGIKEKLFRSFGIGESISDAERAIRIKKLRGLLKEIQPYKGQKTFPGLGLHKDYPAETQKGMPIPVDYLFPVLKKIFRGTEYILGKRYIKPPYEINIYHVYEEPPEVSRLIKKYGYSKSLGPGFEIQRTASNTGDLVVIYKAIIWGTIISYASIDLSDRDGAAN